jgi:hypothetical protein
MTVSLPASPPEQDQLVNVWHRQYIVTEVTKSTIPTSPLRPSGNIAQQLVSPSCVTLIVLRGLQRVLQNSRAEQGLLVFWRWFKLWINAHQRISRWPSPQ